MLLARACRELLSKIRTVQQERSGWITRNGRDLTFCGRTHAGRSTWYSLLARLARPQHSVSLGVNAGARRSQLCAVKLREQMPHTCDEAAELRGGRDRKRQRERGTCGLKRRLERSS
jgi:hypothetical protein